LIEKASYWIDWEIDQIFFEKDISKAEDFQNVVSLLVRFLSKLPQSVTRTHYLQKVSERLSRGQARLAIKFEEDLRKQVKGFRWHGRSQKFDLPKDSSSRDKNESEVIFYYVNCPKLRLFIRDELVKREIDRFSSTQISIIWSSIHEIEKSKLGSDYLNHVINSKNQDLYHDFISIDLISYLPDFLSINHPEIINKINQLINPDELLLTTLSNAKENLLGTLSLLERGKSMKRCRHLIQSWSSQRLKTLENCISILIDRDFSESTESIDEIDDLFKELNSDAIKFQDLYYTERNHIFSLDKQRCGNNI